MNREELAITIYKTSHIYGSFKLRSGKFSNEYFDKYLFESKPELLKEIAENMLQILPSEFDIIAGLEMGAIPLATILSQITGKPLTLVRKRAKEYGTCKFAEGADVCGKKVLIVEDVITSGGQVVLSANDLRSIGAIINTTVCVIDRESGGDEALKAIDIELSALFKMSEIKEIVNKNK
jgi:orotate phosphoribosyltransferase